MSSLAYTVICTVQLHPMYIFWHVLKFKQSSVSKMFKHLSCAFLFCVKRGSIVLFSQVLIIWNHLLAVVVFFVQNIFMLESYDNKWKDAFFIAEHRSKDFQISWWKVICFDFCYSYAGIRHLSAIGWANILLNNMPSQ